MVYDLEIGQPICFKKLMSRNSLQTERIGRGGSSDPYRLGSVIELIAPVKRMRLPADCNRSRSLLSEPNGARTTVADFLISMLLAFFSSSHDQIGGYMEHHICIVCKTRVRFFYARISSFAVTCTRECNNKWESFDYQIRLDELDELRKKLGGRLDS